VAPEGLTVAPGKATGSVLVEWKRGAAGHGFIAQHATDPVSPVTISGIFPVTSPRKTLGGLPSGSTVYFRVAAVDPTVESGQSPWTTWVAGTVR